MKDKDRTSKEKGIVIDTILFFVSFLVYYPLIYFGIAGFGFGMQGAVHYYGFEAIALFLILLWPYSVLTVVCLIGQIKYEVKYLKDHRKLKIAAIAVTVITALCFISVIPVSGGKKKADTADDSVRIKEYLEKKYGEEFASGIRIEADDSKGDSYQRYYKVYTDVLPSGVSFSVHNDMPGIPVYVDDLMETFYQHNRFFEGKLITYLREKCGIPDDMTLELKINSVDFKDYRNGDDLNVLFERTDYTIDIIEMDVDEFSDKNINDCISRVWKGVYPNIKDKVGNLLIICINCQYRCIWVEIYSADDGKYYAELKDNSGFEDTAKYNGMKIELK